MIRRSLPALVAGLLLLSSPAFADVEPGVEHADLSGVQYASARAADKARRDAIARELSLTDRGETRRVRYEWQDDDPAQTTFPVRGVLTGFKDLLVEQYTVADLGQAALFSDQDRERPDELWVLEVRGKQVLILSGKAVADDAAVSRLRDLLWPKSAPKRVDVLGRQQGKDDLIFRFSKEALAAAPSIQQQLDGQAANLSQLAALSPGAKLEVKGDKQRLDLGQEVFSFERSAEATTVGLHPNKKKEQAMNAFMSAMLPASPGAAGALSSATGAPKKLSVSKADAGATLQLKKGGTVTVRLAGNPTTGYQWKLDKKASGVDLVDERFAGPGAGGPVGAGGEFVFVLEATSKGKRTLSFDYRRPWEKKGIETFNFTLEVVD
ncbi:MAG: protease inhibitor I42 family protein [Planctomycetota bacterium]